MKVLMYQIPMLSEEPASGKQTLKALQRKPEDKQPIRDWLVVMEPDNCRLRETVARENVCPELISGVETGTPWRKREE